MDRKEAVNAVKNALEKLGVKGSVRIKESSFNAYIVFVNNKYFGVFDTNKNTFVD